MKENIMNIMKSIDKKPAVIVNNLYGRGVKLAIKIISAPCISNKFFTSLNSDT